MSKNHKSPQYRMGSNLLHCPLHAQISSPATYSEITLSACASLNVGPSFPSIQNR